MQTIMRRLDLSASDSAALCLNCGASYAAPPAVCLSCERPSLMALDEILAHLSASAPQLDRGQLSTLTLVPADELPGEERAALHSALLADGQPFLLLDPESRVLEPSRWDDAETVLIPDQLEESPVFEDPVLLMTLGQVGDEAEAARIRGTLKAAGIPFFVNQAYSPYELGVGQLGEVRWFVDRHDLDRAQAVLRPPQPDGTMKPESEDGDSSDWRAARALRIGRWFLFIQAAGGWLVFITVAGSFLFPLALLAAAVPLGLAYWSRREPRRAFATALGVAVALTLFAVATRGLAGMVSILPVLAYHHAWQAAPRPSG